MADDDELAKTIAASSPLDQHLSAVETPSEISSPVTDFVGKDAGYPEMVQPDAKSDEVDGDESREEVTSVKPAISDELEVNNDGGDSSDRGEAFTCELTVKNDGVDGGESREEVRVVEPPLMSDFEARNDGGDTDVKEASVSNVEEASIEEFSPVNEGMEVRHDEVDGDMSGKEVTNVGGLEKGFLLVNEELVVDNDEVDGNEGGKEVVSVELAEVGSCLAVREELEVKSGEIDGDGGGEDVVSVEQAKMEDVEVGSDEMMVKNDDVDGLESGKEVASVEVMKVEELSPVDEKFEVKNAEVVGEEFNPAIEKGVGENEAVKVDEEVEEDKENVETEEIGADEDNKNEEMKELEGDKMEQEEEEEVKEMEEDGGDESLPVGMTKDAAEEEELGEEEAAEMEDDKKEEEAPAEMEVEMEMETVKSGSGSGGKGKRGRNAKPTPVRTPGKKTVGEDVCYICLDGGDLVLCDRRGCPKAYHPVCVDHDEEFFKTKGRWNCGWHLCNNCGKNAYFMCLTCTFSLCKGCCKDSAVFCVRGNKGFCESCMKTIMTIENGEQNEMGQAAFDDRSSWEYLFKDYWLEQKRKLCISSDELFKAKNPWTNSHATKKQQNIEVDDVNDDEETESDSSHGQLEAANSKRKRAKRKSKSENSDTDSSLEKDASPLKRKTRGRPKSQTKEVYSDSEHSSGNRDTSNKRGRKPKRVLKPRSMEGNSANRRLSGEGRVEWASKELLDFVMHMKDGDTSVLSQFDVQALLLEYIKRNRLRDPRRQSQIICDPMLQKMFGKPRVGHFEMLKLLESHFLVKEDDNHGSVVDETSVDADDCNDLMDAGRSKGKKSRKRGEERSLQSNLDDYAAIDMHNINLVYLRRSLIEALIENTETFHDKVVGSFVRIRISGSQKQDIYRLVQIIGTTKAAEPYKVGKRTTDFMLEILNLDKTENVSIDIISNQEFSEDECKRLRQSIKCGLLSRMTVGDILEKARELQEVRVNDWLEAEIVRLSHLRDRASEKGRKKELRLCVEQLQLLKTPEERQRRIEQIPEVHADPKMDPKCEESEDESEVDKSSQVNMRTRDDGFFRRGNRDHFSSQKGGSGSSDAWSANAKPPNKNWELNRNLSGKGFSSRREETAVTPQTRDHAPDNGVEMGTPRPNSWDKPQSTSGVRSDMSPVTPTGLSQVGVAQTEAKVNEAEKVWHYRDPSAKVQGPFSIVQLRKWSNTGYFPAELRIWKTSQGEDDSILLTDVLSGKSEKGTSDVGSHSEKIRNAPSSLDTSKFSGNVHGSDSINRYGSNLPSPTPSPSITSKRSSTPSSYRSNNQFREGNERLPSPTPISPSSDTSTLGRSNFSKQIIDRSVVGNKVENVGASLGVMQPASVTNPSGQFNATSGSRPDMSLNSGSLNTQQISSQSAPHAPMQSFPLPSQAFSNVVQANTGQSPAAYGHGWQSGYVARPEAINANISQNHPNPVPPQLPQGQWTGAPINNQASSYGVGYPPMGNMTLPPQNAWGPQANMAWANQQQPVNPNLGWSMPPPSGFRPSGVGQVPVPLPSPPTNPNMNPQSGTVNQGRVAPPGNTGGGQWNRQSSFGSGAQRGVCKFFHENGHCRKGSACDFMHT